MDIIKGIKDVAEVVRKADNIGLYAQILDLQKEALELVEENSKLKRRIELFQDNKHIQENLIVSDNRYFLNLNEKEDGPFCTACWDSESKLIRLHEDNYGQGVIVHRCPICTKK
ncbi:hypothetical protein [Lederbergia galactosidilytica]|uniref:Uncharacterized protein n=1 Tax=Lederbergia galactosidilytica TaxID=217031 RepID=A0A177ZQR5_9BACI|nr:hypothetical protein [Lederbergia galactosidilytica]OAK70084.1 hypothetical protein ABB05_12955 [Lederbergia galactosidilytica]